MGYIGLCLFLIIIPVILSLPWAQLFAIDKTERAVLCLPLGYFLEMSLFQFLTYPFSILRLRFSTLCIVFICVVLICCAGSLIWYKNKKILLQNKIEGKASNIWVIIYGIIFIALLSYQVYNAITLDRTYMSYDDNNYVALANDTLKRDALFFHYAETGRARVVDFHRSIQSSLIFPAFLSFVSGVSVVFMEHFILDLFILLISYLVYGYMACVLYKKGEDRYIFLIILSVLYIFGSYSIYSPTMRLLGLDYPGKAVLAIAFFPLVYTLLIKMLEKEYQRSKGVLLMLLSATASGLTLFGTVTMAGGVIIIVLLSMIKKPRIKKHFWYILWGCLCPMMYAGLYFLQMMAV